MWVADGWKDYQVLDASSGEKLEKWGNYILIRPDPQVIWNTPKQTDIWKRANARYHRSTSGGGHWEIFDLPKEWSIAYKSMTFKVKPFNFKHTGIFPEQAVNWDWISEIIKRTFRPVKVLNLFAYTGGATTAMLSAGASVTHVDASKGMVSWAKENAAVSGLADKPVRWIVDDCKKFVEREIRRGNRYDGIVMDPPSYGRGPKKEKWKMENSIYELLVLCEKLLSPDPLFFVLNSYTTGLPPAALKYLLSIVLKEYTGEIVADEIGLSVRESGLILPCGACARWERGKY